MSTSPDARDFGASLLTVVVVSFNGQDLLGPVVGSALNSPAVKEVIVVDNASTDHSVAVAASAGAHIVQLKSNQGYGAACNAGLCRTGTDFVAFCNQDLEPTVGLFETLLGSAVRLQRQYRRPFIVGPRLLTTRGILAETGHLLPSWRRQFLALLFGSRLVGLRDVLSVESCEEQLCDWVSAACIVGPCAEIGAIGGFDESYFMYVEDVDLFERWQTAGGLVAWVPSSVVIHAGGHRPVSPQLQAQALANWVRYYIRTAGLAPACAIALAAVLGSIARGIHWGVFLRNQPQARAYTAMFLGGARRAVRLQFGLVRGARCSAPNREASTPDVH